MIKTSVILCFNILGTAFLKTMMPHNVFSVNIEHCSTLFHEIQVILFFLEHWLPRKGIGLDISIKYADADADADIYADADDHDDGDLHGWE